MVRQSTIKKQLFITATCGVLGILLGAFSAHGLETKVQESIITQHQLDVFEKGVRYQMYHVFFMLSIVLFNLYKQQCELYKSFWFALAGIILFSGSLYWIALQNIIHLPFPKFLFFITPLGGLCFITAWIFLFKEAAKIPNRQ